MICPHTRTERRLYAPRKNDYSEEAKMKKEVFATLFLFAVTSSAMADLSTVRVYAASDPWTDTGVSLPGGGYVDILASGTWCGNVNGDPITWYGPEGTGNPAPNVFLVPGAYSGALVGRIDSGPGFYVGLGGEFDASTYAVGRIWLAFNDQIGAYADNAGFVDVSLTSQPNVVPVPGAFILCSIGLSYAGWRLRRRTT